MTLVRNETQRHSAALKSAGQNPIGLLPLDASVLPSRHSSYTQFFGIDTERVPPNDAMSRLVGFGDKSWDNLKNFQTQALSFLFLPKVRGGSPLDARCAENARLKLNRPLPAKPPACNRK